MKVKDNKNTDEKFAEEAIEAFPVAKEMLIESTGIHAVLALSLADIYGSEAKRLKAKNGAADPRVAEAKLKKSLATENAKEIVEVLVGKRSPIYQPSTTGPKDSKDVKPKPAATAKDSESEPMVAVTAKPGTSVKARPTNSAASKASPKKKPAPKTRSKPPTTRAKPAVKKATTRKVRTRK